jgi:hypothetical protein
VVQVTWKEYKESLSLSEQEKVKCINGKPTKEYGFHYRRYVNTNGIVFRCNDKSDPAVRERFRGQQRRYRERYREEIRSYHREWSKRNRARINEYAKKDRQGPNSKARRNVRKRMWRFISGQRLSKKFMEYVGCSRSELRVHLEKQWLPGMSWENYGSGEGRWNIDHIVPLAHGKTIEEKMILNHYTNLQPLWYGDNMKKAAKIIVDPDIVIRSFSSFSRKEKTPLCTERSNTDYSSATHARKLNWEKVDAIRLDLQAGVPQRKIAAKYGVRQGIISGIHLNKNWPIEQHPPL